MKKLMIAAAVAAIGVGAFADNCTPGQTQADTAWVYVWKFAGKTTVGTLKSTPTGNSCSPGSASCIVRVPGKVSIQGYTYHCNPACTDFASIDASGADDVFWATKPEKSEVTPSLAFSLANLMGKKKKEYEVAGVADFVLVDLENEEFTLNFAGQGKYAGNHPTAISGYFAGSSDNTYYVTSKGVDTDGDGTIDSYCLASQPWNCVTLDCAAATQSAAYGTWSVKFNSNAAKKYAKDGTVLKVPSWL